MSRARMKPKKKLYKIVEEGHWVEGRGYDKDAVESSYHYRYIVTLNGKPVESFCSRDHAVMYINEKTPRGKKLLRMEKTILKQIDGYQDQIASLEKLLEKITAELQRERK